MPATPVTAKTMPGVYSTTGEVLTETACDPTNGNEVTGTDNMVLLVRNAGATPRLFEITSEPDPVTGRTGDASATIAAGELRVFRLQKQGWANASTGKIAFEGAHADLKVSIINI
jgi:hypothetical protein